MKVPHQDGRHGPRPRDGIGRNRIDGLNCRTRTECRDMTRATANVAALLRSNRLDPKKGRPVEL